MSIAKGDSHIWTNYGEIGGLQRPGRKIAMTFRAFASILIFSTVGFAQAPPKFAPIYTSPAARVASEEFSKKKRVAILAQQDLEKMLVHAKDPSTAANDPAIAGAKAKADTAATEAKAAASTVLAEPDSPPAPADKVRELADRVNQIKLQASKDVSSGSRLYLGLTLGGILLALGSSVAGFLKKSVMAGVLSLCTGAVGGMPKALGVDGRIDFYQQVYDGANSLASDMRFDVLVTLRDYNGYVKRLQALEAHSALGAAKSREAGAELMNDLLAAKAPHKD